MKKSKLKNSQTPPVSAALELQKFLDVLFFWKIIVFEKKIKWYVNVVFDGEVIA